MDNRIFSPMDIDALGEMMNISLGSSATAVSNMLDHRVDITTPKVSVVNIKDFQIGNLDPAMGVEIRYVEGLDGSNIMLLRRSDVKVIVDILMGSETTEEEFELNELTISAVCEVMNQMMGAAATAMSDFLGFPVNISTPNPFELEDLEAFKANHLPQGAELVVVVRFSLKIEGALESEFMNVMSVPLAKELLKGLGLGEDEDASEINATPMQTGGESSSGGAVLSQDEIEKLMSSMNTAPTPPPAEPESSGKKLSQEEIEKLLSGMANEEPAPPPPPAPPASDGGGKLSQEEIEKLLSGMGGGEPAPAPTPAPIPTPAAPQMPPMMPPMTPPPGGEGAMPTPEQMAAMGMPPYYGAYPGYPPQMYWPYPPQAPQQPQAQVQPPEPKVINTQPVPMAEMDNVLSLGKEQAENLELIMEVPLQVTVEIGRTHRKVQDILEFSKGSLVVLDKLAGDQVDLFVNGKCIARGDVVVIDDNFGVRITEIVQKPGIEASLAKLT